MADDECWQSWICVDWRLEGPSLLTMNTKGELPTKPHKNKLLKRVMILCNNQIVETTYFELKSMPVKPWSLYHDEPAKIPRGQGYCVVCGKKTKLQCWGCLLELKDVFPVCPTSVRDCFQKMHDMRNEIWNTELELVKLLVLTLKLRFDVLCNRFLKVFLK